LDSRISPQVLHNGWRLARALVVVAAVGLVAHVCVIPAPQFLYERGCRALGSDPARAKRLLTTAVAKSGGDFPDAQIQLCILALSERNWDEARAVSDSLDWRHARDDQLMSLGFVAQSARQFDLARRAFLELRTRAPVYAIVALQNLAAIYDLAGRADDAIDCLEEITRAAPEQPHGWCQLAQACDKYERREAAIVAYRRALENHLSGRDERAARHRLVELLIDAGEAAAAGDELERLVAGGNRDGARIERYREQIARLKSADAAVDETGN
jgi:tetratricopeptide (TPR) repeat protein